MKKFVCLLVAALMIASTALACTCSPSATVMLTVGQIAEANIEMSADELESVSSLALGVEIDCTTAKTDLLRVILRNHDSIVRLISEQRMQLLIDFLGHCCCEEHCGEEMMAPVVTPAPTVAPVSTPRPTQQPSRPQPTPRACVHEGGTHENRGVCSKCGEVYQDHSSPDAWVSENSTWHYAYCSFSGCNVRMSSGRHQWDGNSYGVSANGLKKVYCVICHQYSYIYVGNGETATTPANSCCGCCNGRPCSEDEHCTCGCNK